MTRRRLYVPGFTAVAGAALAAACGGPTTASRSDQPANQAMAGPPVTIRARHKSPGFEIYEQLMNEYNSRTRHIKVEFEKAPAGQEHHEKIAVEMAGGVAPDIFEMESKRMPSFVNGRLLDLTRRFAASKKAGKDVFWPNDWSRAVWEGKHYLLPQFDNPAVLYYHVGAFEKRGVPLPPEKPTERNWTWEGFLDTTRRLTNAAEGTYGFAQNEWWVYLEPWVWSNGGDFLSRDRKTLILDQPAALQAITFAVETRLRHRVFPSAADITAAGGTNAMFFSGTLAINHNISNWVETVRARQDVPWNIAPIPRGSVSFTPRSPATMWAMGSETKQPDRSFEVFEHLASAEVHRQIPMLPSRRDVVEAGDFLYGSSVPGLKWQVFVETKKAARDDPSTAAFMDLDRVLKSEEKALWNGQITAREYVAAVKPAVEQALREAEQAMAGR